MEVEGPRLQDRRWSRHCCLVVSGTFVGWSGIIPSVALDDPSVPLVAAVGSGRAVISEGVLQDATTATKITVAKKISILALLTFIIDL